MAHKPHVIIKAPNILNFHSENYVIQYRPSPSAGFDRPFPWGYHCVAVGVPLCGRGGTTV